MKVKEILGFFDINSEDNTEILTISDQSSFESKKWIYFNLSSIEHSEAYCKEAKRNNAYLIISKNNVKDAYFVADLSEKINSFLTFFYNFKKRFKLIGITGTNGKSSLSNFIKQSLILSDYRVRNITCNKEENAFVNSLTTPKSFDLFEIFKKANRLNLDYLIMEVSSIGICENRVNDIEFDYLFLTNLECDHLDYHSTIENYQKTKINFIKQSKAIKFINFQNINHFINSDIVTIHYEIVNHKELRINNQKINSNLLFKTNLINLAYCFYFLKSLNVRYKDIKQTLKQIKPFKGRLDLVSKNPLIVIDYAHTSSSFENVIKECVEIFKKEIILVYGAGGKRDKTKRKKYAEISNKYHCYSILTNDNPRDENEMEIIDDIKKYLLDYEIVLSRKEAIKRGFSLLNSNKILLILGKGNEDYQIMNGYKIFHNDYYEVEKCLKGLM